MIIPHHKKEPLHELSNYRSISHRSAISRVIEIVINFSSWTTSTSKLLRTRHHRFLKYRSCSAGHFYFLNNLTNIVNRSVAFALIYLDSSKAPGRVPQPCFMFKVSFLGITDSLPFSCSSCLTQRSQVVFIDGMTPSPRPVISHAMHSRVLGPLIFHVY